MDSNQQLFDSVADSYTNLSLMPAERAVLQSLRERIAEVEMLDLGIGAGRTSYTFASLVRRYVGIDYSPRMIELARGLIGESERVELRLGDARELSDAGGPFDLALFSFNGIDAMDHEDRLRTLASVRASLKPDGLFLFSSHSLNTLPIPLRQGREQGAKRSLLRDAYAMVDGARYAYRASRSNREIDLPQARRVGHTVIRDMAHGFGLEAYYVDPAAQLEQLTAAGLELVTAYDTAGHEVDPLRAGRDPWLDYLCRPA
jgi:SAM-dependent methyltransferase